MGIGERPAWQANDPGPAIVGFDDTDGKESPPPGGDGKVDSPWRIDPPPGTLAGDAGKNGTIVVDTQVLRTYASNIESLLPALDRLIENLDTSVDPKAGGSDFTHASELETKTVNMREKTRTFAVKSQGGDHGPCGGDQEHGDPLRPHRGRHQGRRNQTARTLHQCPGSPE